MHAARDREEALNRPGATSAPTGRKIFNHGFRGWARITDPWRHKGESDRKTRFLDRVIMGFGEAD